MKNEIVIKDKVAGMKIQDFKILADENLQQFIVNCLKEQLAL